MWAPVSVWTGAGNLASTGILSPDRPARSESLNRLSYPGPYFIKGIPSKGRHYNDEHFSAVWLFNISNCLKAFHWQLSSYDDAEYQFLVSFPHKTPHVAALSSLAERCSKILSTRYKMRVLHVILCCISLKIAFTVTAAKFGQCSITGFTLSVVTSRNRTGYWTSQVSFFYYQKCDFSWVCTKQELTYRKVCVYKYP